MSEKETTFETKKIMELKDGEQGVNVKGRVLETKESRVIETRRGPRTISEAIIGDDTGRIKATLWGEKAGSLEEGKAVVIKGGWTTSYRGKVQLNIGSRTEIEETNDEDVPSMEEVPEDEPKAPFRRPQGFSRGRPTRRWRE